MLKVFFVSISRGWLIGLMVLCFASDGWGQRIIAHRGASNITGNIMEVFRVTNLDRLLKLYPDEADAMRAFEKEGHLR